jgi:type VI secretion system secreted protein Hcp
MISLGKRVMVAAMVAAAVAGASPARADEVFMKIDTIEGDSQDPKHWREVEVLSWNWGAAQGVQAAGGVATGRPPLRELTITKKIDRSSAKLLLAASTGGHIGRAWLTVRKPGQAQLEYVRILISDVLVTSVVEGAAKAGETPTEEVRFTFGKFDFEYRPQKPDGTPDGSVKSTYDVKTGKGSSGI